MKVLSKLSFLLLLMAVVFAGCDQENIDETITPNIEFEPEVVEVNNLVLALSPAADDGLELECLSVDFPFELLLEDGTTVSVSSTDEFEMVTSEDAEVQVVDFVYPLAITTAAGESESAESIEALALLFAICVPDEGWDNTVTGDGTIVIPAFLFEELCFDLVYPVDLEDAEDNTYVAANEEELIDLIVSVPSLAFSLPLTVTDEDGETVVIESVAEFFDLYYACDGNSPPGTEGGIIIDLSELDSANCDFESLSIQFPYTVVTEDGEQITVVDENQEAVLILSEANYTIAYPFTLEDGSGEAITINNETEFILFILPCLIEVGDPSDLCDAPAHIVLFFNQVGSCGVVNYPCQLEAGGTVYDLNSFDDYFVVYNQFPWDQISIVYPISMTIPDGTTVTFENDEEICAFIENCT